MKLSSKKLLKEELATIKDQWPNVSHYISKNDLKRIAAYFSISEKSTKFIALNTLKRLGYNDEQNSKWNEKRIGLWLSILKICLDENDLFKRWENAKLLIMNSFTEWFKNDITFGAWEIIRDSEMPYDYRPLGPPKHRIWIPYTLRSITEQCLQTIILFNTVNIKIPTDISYWSAYKASFCDWQFLKKDFLISIELINGDVKEKYIANNEYVNPLDFKQSFCPTELKIRTDKGKLVEINLASFLGEFGIPKTKLKRSCQDLINLVFANVRVDKIKEWLNKHEDINVQNEKQIEEILQRGYYLASDIEYNKLYFPEHANQLKKHNITPFPPWLPDNWFLDISNLKIDLGDMYLRKLSKTDLDRTFKQLVTDIGFDPFAYKTFRETLKVWRINGEHEKIQNILNILKRRNSKVSFNKIRKKRNYAIITILLVDEMLKTEPNQLKASKAILSKVKKMQLINFSNSKNPSEQIRIRSAEIIKAESKSRKFNLKWPKDLEELSELIRSRHKIDKSEYK